MAATPGWQVTLKREGVLFAGARTKSLTINNEAIDVTTDDDEGFRTLMETPALKSIDMSIEGVTKDMDIIAKAAAGTTLIETYRMDFVEFGTYIEGEFRLNNVQLGATYNDAVTFTAEVQSTGEYTYN